MRIKKKCAGCGKIRPLTEYHKDNSKKDGLNVWCKDCYSSYRREYYLSHKKSIKSYSRKYHKEHASEIRKRQRRRYMDNIDKERERNRKWYSTNRERVIEHNREYRKKHRERLARYARKYVRRNRKHLNEYRRKKLENDEKYKIACNFRTRIYLIVKGKSKSKKIADLLGCSIEKFRNSLADQFTEGMSWDNYGTHWRLQYIKPYSEFDLTKEEDQKKYFNYKNVRPVCVSTILGDKG